MSSSSSKAALIMLENMKYLLGEVLSAVLPECGTEPTKYVVSLSKSPGFAIGLLVCAELI